MPRYALIANLFVFLGALRAECVPAAPFTICLNHAAIELRSDSNGPSLLFQGVAPEPLTPAPYGRFSGVSPGITLITRQHPAGMEYDWIVSPGADPNAIRMRCGPGSDCDIIDGGVLRVSKGPLEQRHDPPVAFQHIDGRRRQIAAHFRKLGPRDIGFSVGPYDHTRELVIDPVVKYSVALGDSRRMNQIRAMTVDKDGNAYVVGRVTTDDFPTTPGAFQRVRRGALDAFVLKINPEGTDILFSTFLGGSANEDPSAVAVDPIGNVYVALWTTSRDYPGLPPGDPQQVRLVITKLSADGSQVVYSTGFNGDNYSAVIRSVAVDASGSAYFAGDAAGVALPVTSGAFQPSPTGTLRQAFVGRIAPSGTAFIFASYLSGSSTNYAGGIAIDPSGNLLVTGRTYASDFPTTPSAFQPKPASGECYLGPGLTCPEAFVTKINPTGTRILYSTFLGGRDWDSGRAIASDAQGNAYITGETNSRDFPVTPGAFQTESRTTTTNTFPFVAKLDASGSKLLYATFLGEADQGPDQAAGIVVDDDGRAFVSGTVHSTSFPEVNPIQPGRGDLILTLQSFTYARQCEELGFVRGTLTYCTDGFLAILNPDGSGLDFSTYIGGIGNDYVLGLARDGAGNIVTAGFSDESFPAGPLPGMAYNLSWLFKIDPVGIPPLYRGEWLSSPTAPSGFTGAGYPGLARGMIASLHGANITARPGIVQSAGLPLPLDIDGVSLLIEGQRTPLLSIANLDGVEKINFVVPWEAGLGLQRASLLWVDNNGRRGMPFLVYLGDREYGLFEQSPGLAAAIHSSDGSAITELNPAHPDEVIAFFATGLGPVDPPVPNGAPAPSDPLSWAIEKPIFEIGGMQPELLYWGLTPGTVGIYQINCKVPQGLPPGKVSVAIGYQSPLSLPNNASSKTATFVQ